MVEGLFENDIYTVSKIMGHSSVAITEIYANLINKKRDEDVRILNIEINQHDIDKNNNRREIVEKVNNMGLLHGFSFT